MLVNENNGLAKPIPLIEKLVHSFVQRFRGEVRVCTYLLAKHGLHLWQVKPGGEDCGATGAPASRNADPFLSLQPWIRAARSQGDVPQPWG